MKTLKFAFVAVIVSVAMMSFAGSVTQPGNSIPVYRVSLEQALTVPALVKAMYQQLTPSMLKPEGNGMYIGVVKFRRVRVEIVGSYNGWREFFHNKPVGVSVISPE